MIILETVMWWKVTMCSTEKEINITTCTIWSKCDCLSNFSWTDRKQVSTVSDESLTCAQFGEHLHGVIKSLLAEQIEGEEILDVMYLLLLITVWIILHLLAATKKGLALALQQKKKILRFFSESFQEYEVLEKCPWKAGSLDRLTIMYKATSILRFQRTPLNQDKWVQCSVLWAKMLIESWGI